MYMCEIVGCENQAEISDGTRYLCGWHWQSFAQALSGTKAEDTLKAWEVIDNAQA